MDFSLLTIYHSLQYKFFVHTVYSQAVYCTLRAEQKFTAQGVKAFTTFEAPNERIHAESSAKYLSS